MKVYLIDGAKNTFALLSGLENESGYLQSLNKKELAILAEKICRHPEVSVDGCVFVFPFEGMDFAWEFFNEDGSQALMCGNAARAVAYWYYQTVEIKKHINFHTPAQNIKAEILDSDQKLKLGSVKVLLNSAKYLGPDEAYQIYDSGVPHLCVFLGDSTLEVDSFDFVRNKFKLEAKGLRFPKSLDDKGANVTYLWKHYNGLRAVSFERGVEDWTEACGTGAIAAAYFAKEHLNINFPTDVQMPGGILKIDEFEGRTSLSGPAQIFKIVEIGI